MSFSEFLAMGGYALYVWPAFGFAAALLFALLILSRRRLKSREAELALLERERGEPHKGSGS